MTTNMKRFNFPYPIKPWIQSQAWGVYNPAYQRFGFNRHNGTDVALGNDKVVRAPFDGTIINAATRENSKWQPNGGGIFISLLSSEPSSFDDGKEAFVLADFLHCERLLVSEGQTVFPAQALAIADNTGFSTGPHTHIQLRRVFVRNSKPPKGISTYRVFAQNVWLENVDNNDANNTFDPSPYYTKTYVLDDGLSAIQQALNRIAAAIQALRSPKGR